MICRRRQSPVLPKDKRIIKQRRITHSGKNSFVDYVEVRKRSSFGLCEELFTTNRFPSPGKCSRIVYSQDLVTLPEAKGIGLQFLIVYRRMLPL